MVVFLYIIGILFFLIFVILFTTIKVDIKNFSIKNSDSLMMIIKDISQKNFEDILNLVSIKIIITLYFLGFIPYLRISMNNNSMSKLFYRLKIKEKLINKKNKKNINIKIEKKVNKISYENINKSGNKKIKKKFVSKSFAKNIKLDKLKFNLDIGTTNASATALISAIIYILISDLLPYIVSSSRSKNYYYNINQYYEDKNIFRLTSDMILKINIFKIISGKS